MSTFTNFLSNNGNSHHLTYRQYYNNYYNGSNSSSETPSPRTPPNGYNNLPFQFSTRLSNSNSNDSANSSPYSVSPRTTGFVHRNQSSSSQHHNNHHHNHNSLQEIIKNLGKKMHNWRSGDGFGRDRRSSCSEDTPKQEEQFRGRSKSLDCYSKPKNHSDCEATYRIYNTILKEGMMNWRHVYLPLHALLN